LVAHVARERPDGARRRRDRSQCRAGDAEREVAARSSRGRPRAAVNGECRFDGAQRRSGLPIPVLPIQNHNQYREPPQYDQFSPGELTHVINTFLL
jgi:hypothetical protein